jgi:hypothetical protein
VAIRLAYGSRDDIQSAIKNNIIPNGTLIICRDSDEMFFYDVGGTLKELTYKNQFETLQEAEGWVSKYDCGGEIIAVHDHNENACIPYVVGYDGSLRRIDGGTTVVCSQSPTVNDTKYPIGASWLNTSNGYYYYLISVTDGKARWNNMLNPTQLVALGYMNKETYDTDGDGIIDRSSKADSLTTAITLKVTGALATGSATLDGSKDVEVELKPTEELTKKMSEWDAKISSIKIDSKELPIEPGTNSIAIPVATGGLCGVVKSSTVDNTIKVLGDGTMRINKITVDNLKVAEGDELILHCGTSAK